MLTVIDMLTLAMLRAGAAELDRRVFEDVGDGRRRVRATARATDAALSARCKVWVVGALAKAGRA